MPDLGKYVVEVMFAYGASFLIVAGLVAMTWARSRMVRRALEEADLRGASNG